MWRLFLELLWSEGFKTKNYSIRLQKGIKKRCEQLFWTQNQKLRVILFYNFVSNINHLFRSDVTVLTLFSSEIVWSVNIFLWFVNCPPTKKHMFCFTIDNIFFGATYCTARYNVLWETDVFISFQIQTLYIRLKKIYAFYIVI